MKRMVRESLDFTRGGEVKKKIGLGIDPWNPETFPGFVLRSLPEILGTTQIPKDILMEDGNHIKEIYAKRIHKWAKDKWGAEFMRDGPDSPEYNIWGLLKDLLIKMGFEEWENI